ncbi:MAG TPA: hypothetical protein VHB77_06825 [Planctomycetaceae bacterium]|nr:hypothetical protein [Planctomycetaceae bacterium]
MATAQTASNADVDPWEVEVPAPSGNYAVCPASNYAGTIIAVIDIGHHEAENDKGEKYLSRKLIIAVELKKLQPDGQPFILAERYTFSMSEKSNLFKLVSNLKGVKLNQGDKFSPRTLLGTPVMVNVTNGQSAKGKSYHNIGAIAAFPEGMEAPKPVHEPFMWSVKQPGPIPAFEGFPFVYGESIGALCRQSEERKSQTEETESNDSIPF